MPALPDSLHSPIGNAHEDVRNQGLSIVGHRLQMEILRTQDLWQKRPIERFTRASRSRHTILNSKFSSLSDREAMLHSTMNNLQEAMDMPSLAGPGKDDGGYVEIGNSIAP